MRLAPALNPETSSGLIPERGADRKSPAGDLDEADGW
jgi:hypothetical protein